MASKENYFDTSATWRVTAMRGVSEQTLISGVSAHKALAVRELELAAFAASGWVLVAQPDKV